VTTEAAAPVLDASALIAYLREEPGAELVAAAIAGGAVISTVNVAEALSTLTGFGVDPVQLTADLRTRGLLDGALTVEPFTTADATETARLRPLTREAGLSLGDRACLALASRLGAPALTADRAWIDLSLGVTVDPIR